MAEGKKIPREIIEHDLLSNKVTDVLREKIIQGEFPQGYRLIEEDLSVRLGVSRSLIREAVLKLEHEGLIVRQGSRNREVATFGREDYREIYMLRLSIEKLAAETCMANGTVPVAALRKQAEKINQLVEKTPIPYRKLTEADLAFHDLILYAAGNKRALSVWEGLKNQMKTLLLLYFNTAAVEPKPDDYANHEKIVGALENGNREEAYALLGTHILSGLDALLEG